MCIGLSVTCKSIAGELLLLYTLVVTVAPRNALYVKTRAPQKGGYM